MVVMINSDTEVIFPLRIVGNLKDFKSGKWNDLVTRVSTESSNFYEQLAFSWMMVQLCNCGSCNADSFRAMRGCIQCSSQAIRRFHGSENDLIALFEKCYQEMESINTHTVKRKGAA